MSPRNPTCTHHCGLFQSLQRQEVCPPDVLAITHVKFPGTTTAKRTFGNNLIPAIVGRADDFDSFAFPYITLLKTFRVQSSLGSVPDRRLPSFNLRKADAFGVRTQHDQNFDASTIPADNPTFHHPDRHNGSIFLITGYPSIHAIRPSKIYRKRARLTRCRITQCARHGHFTRW